MATWRQDRCRGDLTSNLGAVGVAPSQPLGVAGALAPATSGWVYVGNGKAQADLFAHYRRRRQGVAKRIQTNWVSGPDSPEARGCFVCQRRVCPRCNGSGCDVPRRFVVGLPGILAPHHRFRWHREGDASVKRDSTSRAGGCHA